MDVACEDRYHCKQVLGFFVPRNFEVKSPQFSIISNVSQNAVVVASPIDGCDLGVRLGLIHQDVKARGKLIGFTSERNEKLEYFFSGVIPFGKLLLIPIHDPDRIVSQRTNHPFEDYVNLLKDVDGCLWYTEKAEDALEYLFEVLDADNNGFLSASEMSVFKEFLGLGHCIAEDEWSDALFGWQEGDLDYTLTEMSLSFFKKFIIRLCQGNFSFAEKWTETAYLMSQSARRIKNLERIFECFGFDKDLVPGISRYSIRIYTDRNSMSKFTVISRIKVSAEKVVCSITRAFGVKKSSKRGLTMYTLQCSDWFSHLVKNCNAESRRIVIEYCIVTWNKGVLSTKPGFTWKKVVPGDSETVMSSPNPRKYGYGRVKFHCGTAPVQNHPRAISTCKTLASSELAARLSIIRGSCDDFLVHCDVLYESENGTLHRVSLI